MPRKARSHQRLKKARKHCPWNLQRECGTADTLIFELLVSRTVREQVQVISIHSVCGTLINSCRKLIHSLGGNLQFFFFFFKGQACMYTPITLLKEEHYFCKNKFLEQLRIYRKFPKIVQSSHISIQHFLLLAFYINMVPLSKLMNQYWYIITN